MCGMQNMHPLIILSNSGYKFFSLDWSFPKIERLKDLWEYGVIYVSLLYIIMYLRVYVQM